MAEAECSPLLTFCTVLHCTVLYCTHMQELIKGVLRVLPSEHQQPPVALTLQSLHL